MTSGQGETEMPAAVVMNMFHTGRVIVRNLGEGGVAVIGFDHILEEFSQIKETDNDFMRGCRRRGVHLALGYSIRSFRMIQQLTISRAEIDKAIDVMDQASSELGIVVGRREARLSTARELVREKL